MSDNDNRHRHPWQVAEPTYSNLAGLPAQHHRANTCVAGDAPTGPTTAETAGWLFHDYALPTQRDRPASSAPSGAGHAPHRHRVRRHLLAPVPRASEIAAGEHRPIPKTRASAPTTDTSPRAKPRSKHGSHASSTPPTGSCLPGTFILDGDGEFPPPGANGDQIGGADGESL